MAGWTGEPIELVTPFFVAKMDASLRLVWDCRIANRRFRPCPQMAMGTAAAWGNPELGGSTMYMASPDVRNFFYALANIPELSRYFCSPPVPRWLLLQLGGEAAALAREYEHERVWPFLKVVPMGWSLAFWLGRRAHQHQCLAASGLGPECLMQGSNHPPDLKQGSVGILPYCDNLNVCGFNPQLVLFTKDTIDAHMRKLGFLVHEEIGPSTIHTSLGRKVDGASGMVQAGPKRQERLRLTLLALERRPRVTGRQVEHILGHIVYHFLLSGDPERAALSVRFRRKKVYAALPSLAIGRQRDSAVPRIAASVRHGTCVGLGARRSS